MILHSSLWGCNPLSSANSSRTKKKKEEQWLTSNVQIIIFISSTFHQMCSVKQAAQRGSGLCCSCTYVYVCTWSLQGTREMCFCRVEYRRCRRQWKQMRVFRRGKEKQETEGNWAVPSSCFALLLSNKGVLNLTEPASVLWLLCTTPE